MAKLIFDATGTREYELGASKAVLFPISDTGKYDTGIAWNGITGVTDSPDGAEAKDLYADNIKYASFRTAETFGGTIEAYMYPPEFAACDGTVEVIPGVSFGQQSRRTFGLAYRTEKGNDVDDAFGYKLHLIYGATASPSEKKYESENDSPDAITFSWEYKTTPVSVDGITVPGLTKPLKSLSTITFDSTLCNLTDLENAIYGSAEKSAYLPLPNEVLTLVKKG